MPNKPYKHLLATIALYFFSLAWFNLHAHEDERALCERTVNAYSIHRDNGTADKFGALFSLDTTVTILGKTTSGREETVKDMILRHQQAPTFHNIGTVHIEKDEEGVYRGTTYTDVYKIVDQTENRRALLASVIYKDRFEIKNANCLIKERVLELVATAE